MYMIIPKLTSLSVFLFTNDLDHQSRSNAPATPSSSHETRPLGLPHLISSIYLHRLGGSLDVTNPRYKPICLFIR